MNHSPKKDEILEGEVIAPGSEAARDDTRSHRARGAAGAAFSFGDAAKIQTSCQTSCLVILVLLLAVAVFVPQLFLVLPLLFVALYFWRRMR